MESKPLDNTTWEVCVDAVGTSEIFFYGTISDGVLTIKATGQSPREPGYSHLLWAHSQAFSRAALALARGAGMEARDDEV